MECEAYAQSTGDIEMSQPDHDMSRRRFFWYLVLFGIPLALILTLVYGLILFTFMIGLGLYQLLAALI